MESEVIKSYNWSGMELNEVLLLAPFLLTCQGYKVCIKSDTR